MQVRINGDDTDVAEGCTVADLVAALGLAGRRVAVEYNRAVLPAAAWPGQALAEGDELEIVHFVGGG